MNIIFSIVLVYISLIVQTTFINQIAINDVFPNLPLMIILFISFNHTSGTAWTFSFFTGLALDVYSVSYFGLNALLFTLISYMILIIKDRFFIDDLLSRIIQITVCIFAYYVLFILFTNSHQIYRAHQVFFFKGLPAFLYTSIIMAILVFIFYFRKIKI